MSGLELRPDGSYFNSEAVEINATLHCNLSCGGCSHGSPVYKKWFADPVRVRKDLGVLAQAYRAGRLTILGGEPLLHPDLPQLIAACRESAIADTVIMVTNGIRLPRMDAAVWRALDRVEVSHYPGATLTAADYAAFQRQARDHGCEFVVMPFNHFRESWCARPAASVPLVEKIFKTCKIAHVWHCHTVHDGWFHLCPPAAFLDKSAAKQGVRLDDPQTLRSRLAALLERREPLGACRQCLGTVGRREPHRQVGRRQFWRDEAFEDLVDHDFLAALERDIGADEACVDDVFHLA